MSLAYLLVSLGHFYKWGENLIEFSTLDTILFEIPGAWYSHVHGLVAPSRPPPVLQLLLTSA
jgi:hypothetical protein